MSEKLSSAGASVLPLLELKGVKRRYRQGDSDLQVLVDASLTVFPGEMKALVGPSGYGKSTLLNIAGLSERPDGGEVLIEICPPGEPAQASSHKNHIGFVFNFIVYYQNFQRLKIC